MSLWWRAGGLLIILLWIAMVSVFPGPSDASLLLPSWARTLLNLLFWITVFAFVVRWIGNWPETLSEQGRTRGLLEQKRRNDALEKKLADYEARLQKLESQLQLVAARRALVQQIAEIGRWPIGGRKDDKRG